MFFHQNAGQRATKNIERERKGRITNGKEEKNDVESDKKNIYSHKIYEQSYTLMQFMEFEFAQRPIDV